MANDVEFHRDIQFVIVAKDFKDDATHVDFLVYDVFAEDGTDDKPVYHIYKAGSKGQEEATHLFEAEVYLHGTVDWKGDSDWHIDEQDRGMLRAYGRNDLIRGRAELTRIGEVMARCWDYTKDYLENWKGGDS